ncbi:MAG: sulfatase [Lentisphaeria bacterium]|nr:sulfatase [Lentisphaeria bacterium]
MTKQPNIVLITADDMNWNTVGAYGCKTPECTPNIDALAAAGVRFNYAHVTVSVCQPSRGAIATGRYPHKSGQEGFHHIDGRDVPLVTEELRKAGYLNGILGKIGHSSPKQNFTWDYAEDMPELAWGRDKDLYHGFARQFLNMAKSQDKPFFLMANAHDPHRPFHGNDADLYGKQGITYPPPSRVYQPEEVEVPGFLPDIPDVRREIAEYASSVRRCDDVVGRIVDALKEAGVYENSLIMFLSDNGMAFPFSKTNCYLHSTKTPWIIAWPGKTPPGSVDNEHFISGIDFMPTALEAAGAEYPEGVDGTSFLSLLTGEKDPSRTRVFTQFHENYAQDRFPMRCVQDKRFGYIFNPWSDGKREFKNESQAGRTFKAMRAAAADDAEIADRVDLFLRRVVEELYDFENDPDALHNLVDDPAYADELKRLRTELEAWMIENNDPAIKAFRNRETPEALTVFMTEQEKHSAALNRERNRR